MRHARRTLMLLALLGVDALAQVEGEERPTNLVVLMADDLGYEGLSCYGSAVPTPHLDRLARDGLRFTDFHSSGAVCSPTRAGLVTGRYQQRTGVDRVVNADPKHPDHSRGLRPSERTFAELLRSQGYATALFGKWHLGYQPQHNPTRHGFDRFAGFISGNIDYHSHRDRMGTPDWWHGRELVEEQGYATELHTRHALEFIAEHRDQPFCLYVAYGAIHNPNQGPQDPPVRGPGARPRSELAPTLEAVAAMTRSLDDSVGSIRARLEELGLTDDTLVLFFSDNGGTRENRTTGGKLRGGKGTVWEGGHRVPAVAAWPGRIAPGRVTAQTVLTLDVMPTLLAQAGVPMPEGLQLDGVDLSRLLLDDEPLAKRKLFWEHGRSSAVRDGDWKLVVQRKQTSLFDLSKDLGENTDLSLERPEVVQRMRAALAEWRRDVTPPRALLELQPGEHVAFIGNTLFDRMRDFAYFETLLHQRYPEHQLVVRNLSWSGDQVALRPRPQGFGDIHDALSAHQADVIFAAFGLGESFAGDEALGQFRTDLAAFLAELQEQHDARVVLVSPIAHESQSNDDLATYTRAMSEVATAAGCVFVDLHAPTLAAAQPLTFNGIHLVDRGYRFVASVLHRDLFGEQPPAPQEQLRSEVLEKNRQFFRRYRTLNSFYIYGGRARPYGVVNFPGELAKRDEIVALRDRRIWAVAAGRSVAPRPDDSRTRVLPPFTGTQRINSWRTPEAELAAFSVRDGFVVNCFASEEDFPELACPIQMRWDARGRLWVSCSTTYPQVLPGEEPADKLVILEDTDGDGRADRSHVWADDLHIPLSFALGDGGVYCSEQPHLTFLQDTDGDGKADFRRKVLTGFGTEDSHHSLHDMVWSPDGDLIFRESIFHHSQVETPYGSVMVRESGFFRFRPATGRLIAFGSYRSTNPWGITFDDWGQHQGSHPVFASAVHARNAPYPDLHLPAGDYMTAYSGTCGQEFIYNPHFPDELQGQFFRVRYKPTQMVELNEWAERDTHYEEIRGEPLLRSSDLCFIPVDTRFGPRGALYICDWYNPVKGHMQYSLRDTRRDKTSGRIWRVTAQGRPLLEAPKIAGATIQELLELLKSPVYRHRYWVRRELRERDADAVAGQLEAWLATLDPTEGRHDHHRLEALWVYRGIRRVNTPLLTSLLESSDHRARAAATRQLRYWHSHLERPSETLRKMAGDDSGLVRLEAAIAASYYGTLDAAAAALTLTAHPMDDTLNYGLRTSLDSMKHLWKDNAEFLAANPSLLSFLMSCKPSREPRHYRPPHHPLMKEDPRLIKIETIPGRMAFSVTEVRVKAGEAVQLELSNTDAMPHNLVLAARGAADEIGIAATEMARTAEGALKQFIPESEHVLHHTRMLLPGETETLYFRAPVEPGEYPYLCTFPGHWVVMRGLLIVEAP